MAWTENAESMKSIQFKHTYRALAMLCITAFQSAPQRAWADDTVPKHFKLTVGDYFYHDHGVRESGQDVNLRYRRDDSSFWIGYYHDPTFGGQTRVGADTSWQPVTTFDFSLQPSLQLATQGFVGGSLTAQLGSDWFGQLGIGRTNLHPYQNLNFDPNDAITVAVGHHDEQGNSYTLSTTKDDRLHTGQQHTHAVVQLALAGAQRLTMDVLHKSGNGDSGYVSAWGATVTYDFPSWFVRYAHDPRQNFGVADAERLSVGMRF